MECCNTYLGEFPHNKPIDTGFVATQTGEYIIYLFLIGVQIKKVLNLTIGDDIVIPLPFNENYIYKIKIKQPDGVYIKNVECENFSFKTIIEIGDCGTDCEIEETIIYE